MSAHPFSVPAGPTRERDAIRLVLIGGLPGTGKTTIAERLSAATGAAVISSDAVRKELRAAGLIVNSVGAYGAGAYAVAAGRRVYSAMLNRARGQVASGRSVILDASWTNNDERRRAEELAAELGIDLIELRCVAPATVAAQRIEHRRNTDSDATVPIASAMSTVAAPWPGALPLDTTATLDETTEKALRAYRSR